MKTALFNSHLVLTGFLLALFPPSYLETFPVLNILLAVLKLCTVLILFAMGVSDFRRHMKKKFYIAMIMLLLSLLISTLLSETGSIYGWFTNAAMTIAVCILVGESLYRAPYNGINCLYRYFTLCVLVNTLTIFIFPNAMYANNRGNMVCWFLGEDNGGYIYYIIATTLAMIYCEYIAKKVTVVSWMVYISGFVFVIENDIATGIICQFIWLFLYIIFHIKTIRKLFKAQYVPIIVAVGFWVLVIGRKIILEPVITALGRTITLTGRTVIWDLVLRALSKRPVWGYGMVSGETFDSMILNAGIINAHNWLLMLAFWGGIVAVIFFFITFFMACRDARFEKSTKYYQTIVIGLIVLSIRFFVEAGSLAMYVLLFAMLAYSPELIMNIKRDPCTPKLRILLRKK